MSIYIFGYGSLINRRSAQETGNIHDEFIPVSIAGFKRHCDMLVPDIGIKALGIKKSKKQVSVCGVLYKVKQSELHKYDKRELGYSRIKVNNNNISFYNGSSILKQTDEVFLYESSMDIICDESLGIYRSYIDVCLDGCVDFGKKFVKDFCKSTYFSQKIINDRDQKVYMRPLDSNYNYSRIDWIYDEYLHEYL